MRAFGLSYSNFIKRHGQNCKRCGMLHNFIIMKPKDAAKHETRRTFGVPLAENKKITRASSDREILQHPLKTDHIPAKFLALVRSFPRT